MADQKDSASTPPTTSAEVRDSLVRTLRLDLIGPTNDHTFASELLSEPPTRWYLTGFLVPVNAPVHQRFDETSTEEIDSPAEPGGLDDGDAPEKAAARRSLLPSSMGLSVLVPAGVEALHGTVEWGDYVFEDPEGGREPATESKVKSTDGNELRGGPGAGEPEGEAAVGVNGDDGAVLKGWRRTPHTREVEIALPNAGAKPQSIDVPESGGLKLVITVRKADGAGLPAGTRAVSVFVVNYRGASELAYKSFIFQARLTLNCPCDGFVPRPDPRGSKQDDEWDRRIADLQYRDVFEFAVGHGVSAEEVDRSGANCPTVRTTWIPQAEVERVAPAPIPDVELSMKALGAIRSADEASAKLMPMVEHYRTWIENQRAVIPTLTGSRKKTATDMFADAETAAKRIETGIGLLANDEVREAFTTANRAMAAAARQRFGVQQEKEPAEVDEPRWRPFQLAFLLMSMRGVVEPEHVDRELVDLLFFPTGGGKTEAYLVLAAFTLVLRRLRNPGIRSAGVSVLMRYTLRLLTLDQLSRAAALICALELERDGNRDRLGDWPFEVGLWVGQAATSNRMGRRGYTGPGREYTAYTKTKRFQSDDRQPSPIPIEECPWCGEKFNRHSFRLVPHVNAPIDLRVHCANHQCAFTGDRALPIVAVDEPLYRRLPCFLIATVDKFAALPWTGQTGALFGKVDRHDANGFYGPCDPGTGTPIPGGHLLPPDLIIQDELHLISGPLGTVAGVYETAIDALASREVNGTRIRPKTVASTATVRLAGKQIRAVFDRPRVRVFPPPGPDRRDSFFARTLDSSESHARAYVGVAAQGRSLKVVMLRAGLALLSAGQTAWNQSGGGGAANNPADPYMTWLGYFNSLRELGGSRRIIEDEVRTRLAEYGQRRRRDPVDDLFVNRDIDYEVFELTSRVTTDKVADAKRRLALSFNRNERVDVALATNMISVGLDIIRLGLMIVYGQPKTSAEYIQATSRVGRDKDKPGLIVTLLNIHRPRDRSHYERFTAFHESFYRAVEATSVTPFSPRALDRALAASLIALCRQQNAKLTQATAAQDILRVRSSLDEIAECFAGRAREHNLDLTPAEREDLHATVLNLCNSLLDDWLRIAQQAQQDGSSIQYQREANTPPRHLLYEFLDPELEDRPLVHRRFRANRSMRDVEANVEITVMNLNDWGSN